MVTMALPDRQFSRIVPWEAGMTIGEAIERSGIAGEVESFDLSTMRIGIYGKLKSREMPVHDQDRVEIYRPLVADPKESRRRRAQHRQAGKKG